MKKILIISGVFVAGLLMISCRGGKNDPGAVYMPDMSYSRALETYAGLDSAKFTNDPSKLGTKIFYNNMPVAGTVARGDLPAYPYKNDSSGYINSASVINPLPALSAKDYLEAARLYLVNCGICHGEKLDGNGPLYNGGNGPFVAKPANLIGDAKYTSMAEGTMFHSVLYGLNAMGSYASQLSSTQRWMIIHYIKEKQALTAKPVADSVAVKK
jgi:mono/diheme cytochrome c family protein